MNDFSSKFAVIYLDNSETASSDISGIEFSYSSCFTISYTLDGCLLNKFEVCLIICSLCEFDLEN